VRLLRAAAHPREVARRLLDRVLAAVVPAHRTNPSGNNQSQR
jgi:DNA repair protein RadC